jgi:hypothetical protein
MLFPVTNRGLPEGQGEAMFVPFTSTGQLPPPPSPVDFRFTDQVNVAAGVNVGMGERWFFSANAVVPLTAPRGSSFGGTFSLNYLY